MSVNWMKQALLQLSTEPAVLVTVQATQGSVPRGPGTHMVVFAEAEHGTIGGGHLEFQALAHARLLLKGQTEQIHLRQVLGPSLGQCCGGAVDLVFEQIDFVFGGILRIAKFLECRVFRAPCAVGFAISGELVFRSCVSIKHRELAVGGEQ